MTHLRFFIATLAFVATPALAGQRAPQEAYFADQPADVLAKISSRCMDKNLIVAESDDRHVVCSQTVSGFKGVISQLLIGNSYSTTPEVKYRFQAIPYGGGSRVQFSQWMETQMAFGQLRRVELNNSKQVNETLSALYDLGGSSQPSQISAAGANQAPRPAPAVDPPGTIVAGRAKLVPAKTATGFCVIAPDDYIGSGAANSPAITSGQPRCK